MANTGGGGHEARNEQVAETKLANQFAARWVDGELLDRIVKETMLVEATGNEDDGEELRLLRQVAARYPRTAFNLEPIAVEMVRAVVGLHYRETVDSDEAWQAMTQGIAQTLFDDPRSRERLQAIWHRLSEADR